MISSMVLGFLDQLQIFWQLYLIVLLWLLTGATRAAGLDISMAFIRLWHAGLIGLQVRYLALFHLFSLIDDFEWFSMESLHKNIQLMLEFLRASFLVLHFSNYTLMTFLMMWSVILLSMLMILLSNLSAIRHLIYGNN